MKRRRPSPSKLHMIERFGVVVARNMFGGKLTTPNSKFGDLYHRQTNSYSEVKTAGRSAGAIVVKEQLERHESKVCRCEYYIFVSYKNRGSHNGHYCHLPLRKAKTRENLEDFLCTATNEIYILHISVIRAIWNANPHRIKTHMMQRGLKTYLKISCADIRKVLADLSRYGLNPNKYQIEEQRKGIARFRKRRILVAISSIKAKVLSI